MDKFIRLTATACPFDVANLNTDQLLPARFLKLPRSAGLGAVLLHDLRFDADGARGGGLCAPRLRDPMRDRAILWRHLWRECGRERAIDRDRLRGRSSQPYAPARRGASPASDHRSRAADDQVQR